MRSIEEFKEYINGLKDLDLEKIKKAVFLLQLSRKSKNDHQLFHAIVEGGIFSEEVLEPLKGLVNWNKEDDLVVKELIEKLEKETEGKTFKEKFFVLREKIQEIFKSENFRRAIKVGTIAAAVTAATGLVIGCFSKKSQKSQEKKSKKTKEGKCQKLLS